MARIADGTYPLHSLLPSQRDLAEELTVSRDTVQRVLRHLAEGGWIESRQGRGSEVIKVPRTQPSVVAADTRLRGGKTLGPLLEEAFKQPEVTLDVYSLTSEALHAHLRVQADRIYSRDITPQRIALRLILPSEDLAVPYPSVRDDPQDQRLRDRLRIITQRSTDSLRGLFADLDRLVETADIEIRHAPLTPICKLYLLNGTDALLAPYQVIEREILLDTGETVPAYDALGFGAPFTHNIKDSDPDSPATVFVNGWQVWFDSIWNHVARRPS